MYQDNQTIWLPSYSATSNKAQRAKVLFVFFLLFLLKRLNSINAFVTWKIREQTEFISQCFACCHQENNKKERYHFNSRDFW